MRYLLTIAAMLAATPAFATNWTLAADADDGSTAIFADRDSIEKLPGNRVRVVLIYVLPEDRAGGVAAFTSRNEYDCPGNRYQRLEMSSRSVDGGVLSSAKGDGEWRTAVDGELSGTTLKFVCEGGAFAADRQMLGDAWPLPYGRRLLSGN